MRTGVSLSAPPDLAIATPERVFLELPVAGLGYRTIAYLVDAALLFAFWVVLYFGVSLAIPDTLAQVQDLSGLGMTLLILGIFATQWVYWTAAEVLWRGQTPGKRLMRVRVVREDGSPVGLFESAVRNLFRFLDFIPGFYAVGVVTMLVTRRHRRLGDLVAGTLLIREETIDLDKYQRNEAAPPPVPTSATRLPTEDVELILRFLERAATLEPDARRRLCRKMIERYATELSETDRQGLLASPEAGEAYLRQRAGAER